MKAPITRTPRRGESSTEYNFGNKVVVLQSQRYKVLYLDSLLSLVMFGANFRKLWKEELVWKKEKVTIIHFSSP